MYGIQTIKDVICCTLEFENDVKMYGIQTYKRAIKCKVMFENDVKMYGIQTIMNAYVILGSLRMM